MQPYIPGASAQEAQNFQNFWANKYQEISNATEFKNNSLPLARIKKIMKADEDVRMISAETPVVFARACEMFIVELTLRSWNHTEDNKRRTLQKNDIAAAVTSTDVFDFLVDIIPRDEIKDDGIPYYHMASQHVLHVGATGMTMGRGLTDDPMYGQQHLHYMGQQMWHHNQQLQQAQDDS